MENKAPEVISKTNSLDNGRRVLSLRERESLEQSIQIHSGILNATEQSYQIGGNSSSGGSPVLPPGMQINKARVTQKTKDLMRVLEDGKPEPFNPAQRDMAAKRIKELEDKFAKEDVLESVAELRVLKRDSPHWHTAMDKAAKRPMYEKDIAEWRNLKRRLEPENEEADNLNRLRRSK